MKKNKHTMELDAVRDFATTVPKLLVIVADPKTDTLFVSHDGKAVLGTFGGDVVKRALTKEKFLGAHTSLTATMRRATAQVLNATLDSIEALNADLSDNKKEHVSKKNK